MIYDLKKILDIGEENGFAVPAFKVYNLETVMGVMRQPRRPAPPSIFQMYSRLFVPRSPSTSPPSSGGHEQHEDPRGLPSGSRRGCSRGSAGVPLRRDGRYDRRFQKAPGREHCNHQGRCGDGRGNGHWRRGRAGRSRQGRRGCFQGLHQGGGCREVRERDRRLRAGCGRWALPTVITSRLPFWR